MVLNKLVLFLSIIAITSACSKKYDSSLPNSLELGNPRGFREMRVVTHFHSAFSFDACDKKGIENGVIDANCIDHLRKGLCQSRVDYLFLTDHPSHLADYPMKDLLLTQDGDTLITKNLNGEEEPFANRMGGCDNGFQPTLMAGFEGRLMTFGMERHLDVKPEDVVKGLSRESMYGGESVELRQRMRDETNALVVVPHTESRDLEYMKALNPDGIEIYNVHANLDPKIRKRDLGLPPFENISNLITFLIDPYDSLNADFIFFNFFEIHPIYSHKWSELVASGVRVVGFGGNDSHENIFPQKASDGERLDAHRRMLRFMSSHFLVNNTDPDSIKEALKKGRGWLVFEGFGTPVGMDFFAEATGGVIGVGEAGTLGSGEARIHVKLPSLHPGSPFDGEPPSVVIRLIHVLDKNHASDPVNEEVVAESHDHDIDYVTSVQGPYRAEIQIIPKHLHGFLGTFSDLADRSYPWIVTNHLYLDP